MRPSLGRSRLAAPSLLSLLLLELASASFALAARPQVALPAAPADTAPRTPTRTGAPLSRLPLDQYPGGSAQRPILAAAVVAGEEDDVDSAGPTPLPSPPEDLDDEDDEDEDDDRDGYEVVYDEDGNEFSLVEETIEVLEDIDEDGQPVVEVVTVVETAMVTHEL